MVSTSSASNHIQSLQYSVRADPNLAFTIVWTPLPPITWLLPFIGHTGIADSRGVVSDFQGPYYVGDRGRMAFGNPTRALRLPVENLPGGLDLWDDMIKEANETYRGRIHNICCDNCHSHVAYALNKMGLRTNGIRQWNMIKICFLLFFKARFLSIGGFVKQFLPFILLICLIVLPAKLL